MSDPPLIKKKFSPTFHTCVCSSYRSTIDENLHRLRLENSRCFSLAIVRKASRPSIRSQDINGSGSLIVGGKEKKELQL